MKNLFKVRSTIIMVTAIAILAFAGCTAEGGNPNSSEVISTVESTVNSDADESSMFIDEKSEIDDISKEESSSSTVENSNAVSVVEDSSLESEVESNSVSEEIEYLEDDDFICYGKALEDIKFSYSISGREITFQFNKGVYFYIYKITDSSIYINYNCMALPIEKEKIEILPEDFVPDFDTQVWEF